VGQWRADIGVLLAPNKISARSAAGIIHFPLPGFPLQDCFQFQFDFLKVIAPAIVLEQL
jgi:hypothetical protein